MIKTDASLISGMGLLNLILGLIILRLAIRILDYSHPDHEQVFLLTIWHPVYFDIILC